MSDITAPPRSGYSRKTDDDVRYREIIHPDDTRTGILYPEALAGVVGIRATNIDEGAEIFVKIKGGEDSKVIALMEIIERRCPMKVQIPISVINDHHRFEEWSVNDMLIPPNTAKLLETFARYLPKG
jgi:DNA-directed RNA polymerase subunit K/omega